jgi:hypothetical protein
MCGDSGSGCRGAEEEDSVNATITYRMAYGPHPFNEKRAEQGGKAWVLWRITTPEMGVEPRAEPVAIFHAYPVSW